MKRVFLTFGFAAAVVLSARADNTPELNRHHFPDQATAKARPHRTNNLTYHGGPVIHSARVVSIFWGPSWGSSGSDAATANHIIAFFNQFGTSSHYATITQYGDGTGNIQTTSLGNVSFFDSTTPPTNVTDSAVQSEVLKAIAAVGYNASTIYEVFLPSSSYSSDGTSTSCGGPHLAYCAYHGHFSNGGRDIKYSSMPFPSCGGCQSSGFTTAQNFDHFSSHETREAVTDPDLNAWYDSSGNEADDKCAWSPTPFTDSGFGYQYEWSNSASGCVK